MVAWMEYAMCHWGLYIGTVGGNAGILEKNAQIDEHPFFGDAHIFVWLTGVNLFFPTIFGSVESCGCFGELVHFTPVGSFVKSMVLWMLALVLFVLVHAGFMNNSKR